MTHKSARIAQLVSDVAAPGLDPRYAGFFALFNQQRFYEAHEVLEDLWLESRGGPDGAFYKGLIQLAGAFVHLQKNRLPPAAALLRLADANLQPYAPAGVHLDVAATRVLIHEWLQRMEPGQFPLDLLSDGSAPKLTPTGDASVAECASSPKSPDATP